MGEFEQQRAFEEIQQKNIRVAEQIKQEARQTLFQNMLDGIPEPNPVEVTQGGSGDGYFTDPHTAEGRARAAARAKQQLL